MSPPHSPVKKVEEELSDSKQQLIAVMVKGDKKNLLDPAAHIDENGNLPDAVMPLHLTMELLSSHAKAIQTIEKELAAHREDVTLGTKWMEEAKAEIEDVKEKKVELLKHTSKHASSMEEIKAKNAALESLVNVLQERIELLEAAAGKMSNKEDTYEWDAEQKKIAEDSRSIARSTLLHCPLCQTSGHILAQCQKYNSKRKVFEEFQRQGLCRRCAEAQHPKDKACKYQLTRCDRCLRNGNPRRGTLHHLPELCLYEPSKDKTSNYRQDPRRDTYLERPSHPRASDTKRRREQSPVQAQNRHPHNYRSTSSNEDQGGPSPALMQHLQTLPPQQQQHSFPTANTLMQQMPTHQQPVMVAMTPTQLQQWQSQMSAPQSGIGQQGQPNGAQYGGPNGFQGFPGGSRH